MITSKNKDQLKEFINFFDDRVREYVNYMRWAGGVRDGLLFCAFSIYENSLKIIFEDGYDGQNDYVYIDLDTFFLSPEDWKKNFTDFIERKKLEKEKLEKDKIEAEEKKKEAKERAMYEKLKKKFGE